MMKSKYTLGLLCLLLAFTACHKTVGPTNLYVVDPVRHYYPVVQGEDVRMSYQIVNLGPHPLVVHDIQPADMNIELVKEAPHIIPPLDSIRLPFIYHTSRNIGHAEHVIRIFGNIGLVNGDSVTDGVAELKFDIHLVRPTVDNSDYEERYYASRPKNEEWINGTRGEQGYFTDEDVAERVEVDGLRVKAKNAKVERTGNRK